MASALEKELVAAEKVSAKDVEVLTVPEINAMYDMLPEQIAGWKTMKKKSKAEALAQAMTDLGITLEEALTSPDDEMEDTLTTKEVKEAKTEPKTEEKTKVSVKPKTTKVAEKVEEAEHTSEDKLTSIAKVIEAIQDEKEATTYALDLIENEGMNEFKLGGIFSVMLTHGWKGDTKETYMYITDTFELGKRKAQYCVAMYNSLVNAELSWQHVKSIGWTKLKEITDIITLDTVDFWIEKANEMNIDNFKAFVKDFKKKLSGDKSETIVSNIITKTLKFHEDQAEIYSSAVQKAKEINGTEYDTVAIENICLEFLGSGSTSQANKEDKMAGAVSKVDLGVVMEYLSSASKEDLMEIMPQIFSRIKKVTGTDEEALNTLFGDFAETFPYDLEFSEKS